MLDPDEFHPCDTCGQRSFVFVMLPSDLELSYCGHHGREYREALLHKGAIIDDLAHLIGYA